MMLWIVIILLSIPFAQGDPREFKSTLVTCGDSDPVPGIYSFNVDFFGTPKTITIDGVSYTQYGNMTYQNDNAAGKAAISGRMVDQGLYIDCIECEHCGARTGAGDNILPDFVSSYTQISIQLNFGGMLCTYTQLTDKPVEPYTCDHHHKSTLTSDTVIVIFLVCLVAVLSITCYYYQDKKMKERERNEQ